MKTIISKVHNIFLIMLFTGISIFNSHTQVEVIEDDPYNTKLIIQLKLADFECGMSDILRYSIGIRGDYFFPKTASVNVAWHQTIFSSLVSSDAVIMENKNKNLAQFRMLEAGGRLHLSDKKGAFKAKGYMKTVGVYSYWAIMKDIPVRKIFGLRGGLYSTVVPVSSNWSTLDNGIAGGIVASDGSIIGKYSELFTNMRTSGLYGGLSWGQFANAKYKSHGKTWESKFFKEIYFDVLYTPKPKFGSFIDINPYTNDLTEYEIEPNAEGSLRTSNIGWRVGVYRVKSRKKINVAFGLEAGGRPGIFFKGGYFTSSIALSFSSPLSLSNTKI